jgi:hypothetical protein
MIRSQPDRHAGDHASWISVPSGGPSEARDHRFGLLHLVIRTRKIALIAMGGRGTKGHGIWRIMAHQISIASVRCDR